jgi:hypothetical protein
VVLGAAEALHALSVRAGGRIDVFRDRRGADEADGADARIGEQRVDRFLVAVDDVEHAGREPGFDQQLGKPHRHARVALRRLEDEGIAAGERRRELPHRNHGREVERRDAGDDAERLTQRVEIDAGPGAVGEFALEQVRDATGELDHLEAALNVALGIGDGLAVLGGEELGERIVLLLHQFQELEQHARAALRIGRGPGRLRRLGIGDGLLHLRFGREGDLGLDLAGIRVEHVAAAAGRSRHGLAADEMADVAHGASSTGIVPRARMGRGRVFLREIAQLSACGKRVRKVTGHGGRGRHFVPIRSVAV